MKTIINIIFITFIFLLIYRIWYLNKNNIIIYNEFKIDGGTYDQDIFIVITENKVKAKKFIESKLDTTIEESELMARAVTYPSLNGKPIVIWLSSNDNSLINHELFHATIDIMNWAEVPLNETTEESYAYEFQYITNQFYKHLK